MNISNDTNVYKNDLEGVVQVLCCAKNRVEQNEQFVVYRNIQGYFYCAPAKWFYSNTIEDNEIVPRFVPYPEGAWYFKDME